MGTEKFDRIYTYLRRMKKFYRYTFTNYFVVYLLCYETKNDQSLQQLFLDFSVLFLILSYPVVSNVPC